MGVVCKTHSHTQNTHTPWYTKSGRDVLIFKTNIQNMFIYHHSYLCLYFRAILNKHVKSYCSYFTVYAFLSSRPLRWPICCHGYALYQRLDRGYNRGYIVYPVFPNHRRSPLMDSVGITLTLRNSGMWRHTNRGQLAFQRSRVLFLLTKCVTWLITKTNPFVVVIFVICSVILFHVAKSNIFNRNIELSVMTRNQAETWLKRVNDMNDTRTEWEKVNSLILSALFLGLTGMSPHVTSCLTLQATLAAATILHKTVQQNSLSSRQYVWIKQNNKDGVHRFWM